MSLFLGSLLASFLLGIITGMVGLATLQSHVKRANGVTSEELEEI